MDYEKIRRVLGLATGYCSILIAIGTVLLLCAEGPRKTAERLGCKK